MSRADVNRQELLHHGCVDAVLAVAGAGTAGSDSGVVVKHACRALSELAAIAEASSCVAASEATFPTERVKEEAEMLRQLHIDVATVVTACEHLLAVLKGRSLGAGAGAGEAGASAAAAKASASAGAGAAAASAGAGASARAGGSPRATAGERAAAAPPSPPSEAATRAPH